jgi:[acyl-carrier-protein] S-malonyltransferase
LAHVASVAGRRIPVSRLEHELAQLRRGRGGRHLPPDDGPEAIRLRRWLAQDLVAHEVVASEARAIARIHGEERDNDGDDLTPAILRDVFVRVTNDVSVSDESVRAYYERNLDRYSRPETRTLRHAVANNVETARAIGAVMATTDSGETWHLRKGEFAGAFEDAVLSAREGDIVGPLRTEHGWHVARLVAIAPARTAALDEVRADIHAELLAIARARRFGEWLEQRRRELAVFEPEYEHPGHPVHGLPSHRH